MIYLNSLQYVDFLALQSVANVLKLHKEAKLFFFDIRTQGYLEVNLYDDALCDLHNLQLCRNETSGPFL